MGGLDDTSTKAPTSAADVHTHYAFTNYKVDYTRLHPSQRLDRVCTGIDGGHKAPAYRDLLSSPFTLTYFSVRFLGE